MRKQTVLLVMALCIMGIVTCVMWGERDAERALRSSVESRLAQTREQLMQAQALQEDAEDALSAGKETWQEQLATVTAERDELSVSNAALQAQAEEAANALAQAQTQQESLEASLTETQAAATAAESALAEKTAALEAMGQELATAQANASTAETLETKLDQLQQDKDTLAAELTDCEAQLDQAQTEKARLTAELEQAQTGQARYEALRKETEAARLIWDMMEQDMDNLAVRKSVEAAIANFQQKYPDSLMVFRLPDQ